MLMEQLYQMNKATFCSTFSSSNTHARIILDPSVIYPSLTASDGTNFVWDRGGKYILHVRPVNQTGQVLYNNTGPRLDGIVVKVHVDNINNAFLLNGELVTGDFILYNRTNHIIDLSDSSISNKGFSLSLTQDGTHNGGTKYTGSTKKFTKK